VSFVWPAMLLLLAAIPLGVLLYRMSDRRRRTRLAELGHLRVGATSGGTTGRLALRRRVPAAFVLAGLTVLVLAMARPQSVISTPRFEGTVILSFDVSGSMAADDVEPTRMEAAKTAARAFVARQPPSILTGVVAFSDSGFNVLVPTADQTEVLAAIDRLDPERGTSIARGIISSLTAIAAAERDPAEGYYTNRSPDPVQLPDVVSPGTSAPAAIVLLSDGENNQRPDPLEAAQAAAERGIRIFTVGVGTAEGTTLEIEGFRVHSRLDEPSLRLMAELTGGTYYAATDPAELESIYRNIETRLVLRPEATEVTSLFAGAAVLLLTLGALAGLRWLGRLP
jgi:Ca-activated chloride channel family protein